MGETEEDSQIKQLQIVTSALKEREGLRQNNRTAASLEGVVGKPSLKWRPVRDKERSHKKQRAARAI